MTILSARDANEQQTAVELTTQESGKVLIFADGPDTSGWREVYEVWKLSNPTDPFSPDTPSAIDQAKAFVARRFDGLELLTMKDWTDKLPAEATPKLQACYGWVQGVIAAAAAGETSFTNPPHTFAEVLAEISALNAP